MKIIGLKSLENNLESSKIKVKVINPLRSNRNALSIKKKLIYVRSKSIMMILGISK
jgi:hypothetical protein